MNAAPLSLVNAMSTALKIHTRTDHPANPMSPILTQGAKGDFFTDEIPSATARMTAGTQKVAESSNDWLRDEALRASSPMMFRTRTIPQTNIVQPRNPAVNAAERPRMGINPQSGVRVSAAR